MKRKTIPELLKEKYGSKHSDNGQHPPEEPPTSGTPVGRPSAVRIIVSYWRKRYDPIFKRELAIYSQSEGRDIRSSELLGEPTTELIDLLAGAAEAPKTEDGAPIRSRLPGIFRTWASVAWGDLKSSLPFEEDTEQITDIAREQFQGLVSSALLSFVSLSYTYSTPSGDERNEVQRKPLISWARLLVMNTRWHTTRDYLLWARLAGDPVRVELAMRVELFSQLHIAVPVRTQRTFTTLCELYGVGKQGRVRSNKTRAVILNPLFLKDLTASPAEDTNEK